MTEVGNFNPLLSFRYAKVHIIIEELLYIYNTFNNNYRREEYIMIGSIPFLLLSV